MFKQQRHSSCIKLVIGWALVNFCSGIRLNTGILDLGGGIKNSFVNFFRGQSDGKVEKLFKDGKQSYSRNFVSKSVLPDFGDVNVHVSIVSNDKYLPVVQMHGMGDFAENSGISKMRDIISSRLEGAYVVNAKLSDSPSQDAMNSYFMNMDKEVETFAKQMKADPKLQGGFNAIGYSQGNLVIRGYVERFNDPPVFNFVSIHGPMLGVAGFPQCDMKASICKTIDHSLGILAYTSAVQNNLAQANYFRDPMRINQFLKGDLFLADVNNDRAGKENWLYKENFSKLNKLVLVKAKEDTEIFPRESEWFGYYRDGGFDEILSMEDTVWYSEDRFGLKTLAEAGKIYKHETPGNHLQFSQEFLIEMVNTYFKEGHFPQK